MRIDSAVEQAVRVALSAAVTQNSDGLGQALKRLESQPSDQVFGLVHAIGGFAMADINDREPVSDERLDELTENFRHIEDWIDTAHLPVREVLRGLAYPLEVQEVAADELLVTEVLVNAWLLSGFLDDEGGFWDEYLDKILLTIESPAGPTR